MEPALALLVGLFYAASVFLLLSRSLIRILLGIVILSNAANLLIFTSGRILRDVPPIIPFESMTPPGDIANPLPQALILTAIVISFSIFIFVLVLVFRAYQALGTDLTPEMREAEPAGGPRPPEGYLAVAVETLDAPDLTGIMTLASTPPGDWLAIGPTVVTMMAGAVLLILRRNVHLQAWLAVGSLVVLVAVSAALLVRVVENGPVAMTMGRWLPPFGISFAADLLGASLVLVSSIVALAVAVYAARDVDLNLRRYGFYPLLLLMMTGVCGAFLTADIFNLYVWFEVLLIASFGLIVIGNSKAQLDGAVRYALLNIVATTLFLIATGFLYGALGTLNMADIALKMRELDGQVPISTITALYILAFGMKAAAFPVNFWLPASYHTPAAAVSAVFAGLLTKVGAYALLRLLVMLMPGQRDLYSEVLVAVAIATMLTGVLGALAQSDIRRMLGFLVISGIGLILAGLAIGTAGGVAGAIFYAIHSMVVITALYLAAGMAGRIGASFELRELGGLYLASPLFAALFLVLVFAVAGLPPFSGFWPKVVLTQAALLEERWWLAASILLTGLLTTIAGGRAFIQGFWRGGPVGTPDGGLAPLPARLARQDSAVFLAPLAGLTALAVLIGLWPGPLLAVADAAAIGLLDPAAYLDSILGEVGERALSR